MIKKLAQELYQVAKERDNQYPVKSYDNRWRFDEKLEELAELAVKESGKIKINKEILPLCERFRTRPVFVCGYYKSGTSLLNALLDYHPEVVSLLQDSRVLSRTQKIADSSSKENYFLYLSREYVKRLYSPTGHFPMNLYSNDFKELDIENYASFVAYLRCFIDKGRNKADLLSSCPCAIFATNGQFQKGHLPKIWVEKTPTNEQYIELAKGIFPNAKFIFIVRNPYDNLASRRRWYINSEQEKRSNLYMYFYGLKKSLKKAIEMRKRDDFYLIRYEDLVLDPEKEMRNVSKFLDIDYNDSLTVPTIMGVPDRPNISDVKDKNRKISGVILRSPVGKYKKSLTQEEIRDITLEFYKVTKSLGYKIEPLPNFYKLFRYLPLKTKQMKGGSIIKSVYFLERLTNKGKWLILP